MANQGQQQQQQRVSKSSKLSCRANLQGTEETIFDLVCAGTSRRQWAEWLRTPLEHAAGAGNLDLVTKLQGAGAGGSALHLALRAGQDALARELLRLGAPTKAKDTNGDTPLHLAAASGLGDVVSLLLRDGSEVDVLDSEGRTPIHLSAERGSLCAVQALLAAGGDPSLRYGKDKAFSALGLAASGGNVEVMQALIRHGADVNASDSNGCTALHSAAIGDKVGAIDTLIEAGANINVQGGKYDDARSTPLHMASKQGSSEAALSLVNHGADVHRFNRERDSALRLAARDGHILIVKTLLAAGARVNLRQEYLESALDSACWGGHADIVTTLIQHGAVVDAADSRGCTALFKIGQDNSVAVIDKLVAAGASVNGIVDHSGITPLHQAFMDECPAEAIVSMLRHGARVNVKDNDGKTPLHAACVMGCSEGIRALVQHGADINAITAEGRTPLSLAADNNWDDATKFLLDAGADVNAPARITDESQALSLAASRECVDAMKVLIQHGADVNARDTNGYSALHHATLGNQVGAIDALISAGAIIDAQENHMSTPLAIAFRSAFRRGKKKDNRGSEEFAAMITLLKRGADPNIRNIEEGCPDTLLHYCIAHKCPIPVFRELLAAGPNLEARDGKGCTPLLAAGNNLDLLQALLGGGADMEAQDSKGRTALHKAADSGNVLFIDALISAGATADVKDIDGCTPLHIAAWSHERYATLALLQAGADVASIDNYGCSPLHLAASDRHYDLNSSAVPRTVDLLLRWNADENAVDSSGETPAIKWGKSAEYFGVSSANTESVPQLFERAPRDKAWRRRGWLLLCRAFPSRVQLKSERGRTCGAVVRRVRARSVGTDACSGGGHAQSPGKANVYTADALTLEGRPALGGLSALVAKVVGLHEEGMFRAIMEFV